MDQREEAYRAAAKSSLSILDRLLGSLNDVFSYRFDESVEDRSTNRRFNLNFSKMKQYIQYMKEDLDIEDKDEDLEGDKK